MIIAATTPKIIEKPEIAFRIDPTLPPRDQHSRIGRLRPTFLDKRNPMKIEIANITIFCII